MDFWDKTAGIYDIAQIMNGKVWREMTDLTERLVPKRARVLDCAAGTGIFPLPPRKKRRACCAPTYQGICSGRRRAK